jgi:opacity protein-like surface antigen
VRIKLILIGLFLAVAIPVYPQAKPAAIGSRSQFALGAGFSDYYSDWSGRYDGGALWVDWNPGRGPSLFQGLGLEIEARDLNFDRTGGVPHLRLDTVGGGPIYTIRHYRNIHPYGKFLVNYASFDFQPFCKVDIEPCPKGDQYSHDTRTDYAPGGGVEYRVARHLWVRGDYEYQFFVYFFNHHAMNPNGFTVGASYDFSSFHHAQ